MPKIYVKNSGVWSPVLLAKIKNAGSWVNPSKIYVKNSGSWVQVYPESSTPTIYSTAGTFTYTVPLGITSLSVALTGGGVC